MIHLCYSNRTEELLAALVREVAAERAGRSPFEPVRLVVPNRNVETYVKLGLAQATGIAANLEVTFLRRLLGDDCRASAARRAAVRRAARSRGTCWRCCTTRRCWRARVFAPVREYLGAAGERPDAIDRRRCQLAAELAQLFDEYAGSRPELLPAWRERRPA